MSANSMNGSPGHDVNQPPFPQLDGQAAGADPGLVVAPGRDRRAARRARAGDHEVDKAVEIDTHHMGFAVYRPALSRVVDRDPDVPDRGRRPAAGAAADGGGAAGSPRASLDRLISAVELRH